MYLQDAEHPQDGTTALTRRLPLRQAQRLRPPCTDCLRLATWFRLPGLCGVNRGQGLSAGGDPWVHRQLLIEATDLEDAHYRAVRTHEPHGAAGYQCVLRRGESRAPEHAHQILTFPSLLIYRNLG